MQVQIYIDGKLALEGEGTIEEVRDDEVELIVEKYAILKRDRKQFIVQVPSEAV